MRREQLLDHGLTHRPFLRAPNVLLCDGPDQRRPLQLIGLPTSDFIGNPLDQAIGHVLEHDRLQREPVDSARGRTLEKRAPVKCASTAFMTAPRPKIGLRFAMSSAMLTGSRSTVMTLRTCCECRAAIDLLGEHPPHAAKRRGFHVFVGECTNVAAKHLTDTFADDHQRQGIRTEFVDELGPIFATAREPLVGQQNWTLGNVETADVDSACDAGAKHAQLEWRLTAGQQDAALVARIADGVERSVAGKAIALPPLAQSGLQHGFKLSRTSRLG